MWRELIHPPQIHNWMALHGSNAVPDDILDLSGAYVAVGPYTIQNRVVYGAPDGASAMEIIELLRQVPGVVVDIARTGEWAGYGHGTETVTVANTDGSLIYQIWHIGHCAGPGFRCSYSHGPWEKYGRYNGEAPTDPELAQALATKAELAEKFRF